MDQLSQFDDQSSLKSQSTTLEQLNSLKMSLTKIQKIFEEIDAGNSIQP